MSQRAQGSLRRGMGHLTDPTTLVAAWRRVAAGGGGAGVDGVTVEKFARVATRELGHLRDELLAGTYRPRPLLRVRVKKAAGAGERILGIPTVRDRVCQHAVLRLLEPVFDPTFCDTSFGYRKGRSVEGALDAVREAVRGGKTWLVDGDIRNFFDEVCHRKLMMLVARRVRDRAILDVIWRTLRARVLDRGRPTPVRRGVPQGVVFSPLLANVYLTPFDRALTREGWAPIRYGDDWVIPTGSLREARHALDAARALLERLGLELHPQKTRIVPAARGVSFLGRTLDVAPRTLWRAAVTAPPDEPTLARFRHRVMSALDATPSRDLARTASVINPLLQQMQPLVRSARVRWRRSVERWVLARVWRRRWGRVWMTGWLHPNREWMSRAFGFLLWNDTRTRRSP